MLCILILVLSYHSYRFCVNVCLSLEESDSLKNSNTKTVGFYLPVLALSDYLELSALLLSCRVDDNNEFCTMKVVILNDKTYIKDQYELVKP